MQFLLAELMGPTALLHELHPGADGTNGHPRPLLGCSGLGFTNSDYFSYFSASKMGIKAKDVPGIFIEILCVATAES